MELGAFAAALVRRWYFLIVAVVLATGACVGTLSSTGPTYETRATVLLFPPASDGKPGDDRLSKNPYLELVGLNSARDILIRSLNSQSEQDSFNELHPDADYGLANDPTTSAPVLMVEVSASSDTAALEAQATLLEILPDALANLQHGLGLSNAESITAREITVDRRAEAVHKSQIRAAIVVTVAVMALFLALIGLVDGMLETRRQARRPADDDDVETLVPAELHPATAETPTVAHKVVEAAPTEVDTDAAARVVHPASQTGARPANKRARKQARREARDQAERAARERARTAVQRTDRKLDRARA